MRLKHAVADYATMGLAEPPDVFAFHRPSGSASAPLAEGGPEQRGVQLDVFDLNREVLRDVTIEILHHGPGQWDAAGLAAYYRNVA
jgi:hypothetical protein